MPTLSVVMIVKNEEQVLGRCLESVKEADEIVILDSVASYSPVIVRRNHQIEITTLEELFDNIHGPIKQSPKGEEVKECNGIEVWNRMKGCRKGSSWAQVNHILRHHYQGKLIRVNTLDGVIDVTPNHSLFSQRGKSLAADSLNIGDQVLQGELINCHKTGKGHSRTKFFCGTTELAWAFGAFAAEGSACQFGEYWKVQIANQDIYLLERCKAAVKSALNITCHKITNPDKNDGTRKLICNGEGIYRFFRERFYDQHGQKRVPSEILNAPDHIRQAFLSGYMEADGYYAKGKFQTFTSKSWLLSQGIIWIWHSLDRHNLCVHVRDDKPDIIQANVNLTDKRMKNPQQVKKIRELDYSGMVYDLSTDSGRFQTGIGAIFAHNTGSEDKTKEVASKYTDKFIENEYTWCDDFGGARNKAKEYATSDWILSIDADEVLEPDGIARIKQNIELAEDTNSDTVDVIMTCPNNCYYYPRCFKNDPNIVWRGAIHEIPITKRRAVSDIKIIYGSSPSHARDPNRSLRILKKHVKENPNCKREVYYLAREYTYKKEWEKAIYWFQRYVERAVWRPEKADAFYLLARSYWSLNRGDDAREACLKAILLNPNFKESLRFMAEMSWPKQRKRWLEMAEKATNQDVLFTRESSIRRPKENKAVLDFIVLGHPRSGTRYMSELFTGYGFQLRHEQYGRYGTSSWLFAVDTDEYPQFYWEATGKPSNDPNDHRDDFDYRHIIHVVRDPLKTIASTMHTEDTVSTSLHFRKKYATMYGNPYMVATLSYLNWNRLIKAQKPSLTVKVEEAEGAVFDFLVKGGYLKPDCDKGFFPQPDKSSNSRPHDTLDGATLRAELPAELWLELVEFSNEYGYDL